MMTEDACGTMPAPMSDAEWADQLAPGELASRRDRPCPRCRQENAMSAAGAALGFTCDDCADADFLESLDLEAGS